MKLPYLWRNLGPCSVLFNNQPLLTEFPRFVGMFQVKSKLWLTTALIGKQLYLVKSVQFLKSKEIFACSGFKRASLIFDTLIATTF